MVGNRFLWLIKKLIIIFIVAFIIESSLSSPTYVMMQTPFMQKALKDALLSWGENDTDSLKQAEYEFDFGQLFDFSCIRKGDESLLDPFLVSLRHHTREYDMNPKHVRIVSLVLFRLVIARCYLKLEPFCDEQLYWLSRRLTDNEMAALSNNERYYKFVPSLPGIAVSTKLISS